MIKVVQLKVTSIFLWWCVAVCFVKGYLWIMNKITWHNSYHFTRKNLYVCIVTAKRDIQIKTEPNNHIHCWFGKSARGLFFFCSSMNIVSHRNEKINDKIELYFFLEASKNHASKLCIIIDDKIFILFFWPKEATDE